jgi:hypothetical protein
MSRKRFYEENDYDIEFSSSNLKEIPLDFNPDECRSFIMDLLDESEKNGLLTEQNEKSKEDERGEVDERGDKDERGDLDDYF